MEDPTLLIRLLCAFRGHRPIMPGHYSPIIVTQCRCGQFVYQITFLP